MLALPHPKRGRPIEKPDDNHRKRKLESVTAAIYLHSCKMSFGKIIAGGVGMENKMRLSGSRRAEVALAFGSVLPTLVLAASNSVAEAGGSATVTRHLTLHHEPLIRVLLPRSQRSRLSSRCLLSDPMFRLHGNRRRMV